MEFRKLSLLVLFGLVSVQQVVAADPVTYSSPRMLGGSYRMTAGRYGYPLGGRHEPYSNPTLIGGRHNPTARPYEHPRSLPSFGGRHEPYRDLALSRFATNSLNGTGSKAARPESHRELARNFGTQMRATSRISSINPTSIKLANFGYNPHSVNNYESPQTYQLTVVAQGRTKLYWVAESEFQKARSQRRRAAWQLATSKQLNLPEGRYRFLSVLDGQQRSSLVSVYPHDSNVVSLGERKEAAVEFQLLNRELVSQPLTPNEKLDDVSSVLSPRLVVVMPPRNERLSQLTKPIVNLRASSFEVATGRVTNLPALVVVEISQLN